MNLQKGALFVRARGFQPIQGGDGKAAGGMIRRTGNGELAAWFLTGLAVLGSGVAAGMQVPRDEAAPQGAQFQVDPSLADDPGGDPHLLCLAQWLEYYACLLRMEDGCVRPTCDLSGGGG